MLGFSCALRILEGKPRRLELDAWFRNHLGPSDVVKSTEKPPEPSWGHHRRTTAMNLKENSKRIYSAWTAFVGRNFLAVLLVTLILLQPVIWLVMRSLQDTLPFYRCGNYDYPCHVIIQPEPRPDANAPRQN
jgi:hypothetical protein